MALSSVLGNKDTASNLSVQLAATAKDAEQAHSQAAATEAQATAE
jgi:hypothetical protein